ncbi:MAG: nucleotidyltransferase domain-containing protein [Nanoarchaeota archaeon]
MQLQRIERIMREILAEREQYLQKEFQQHYNVAAVLLYGSRVRGDNRPDSDIDFRLIGRTDRTTNVDNFKYLLKNGLYRAGARKLTLDCFDVHLISTNFKEMIFSQEGVMKGHYRIVTPFKDIRKFIERSAKIDEHR